MFNFNNYKGNYFMHCKTDRRNLVIKESENNNE